MRYLDSLPEGLPKNARWQVVAPEGGIKDIVEALIAGQVTAIDLTVRRDDALAVLRVMPDPQVGVTPDERRAQTYHLHNALAIFLDQDGYLTTSVVKGHFVVQTENVPAGLSAGHVVMWPPDLDGYIATAS